MPVALTTPLRPDLVRSVHTNVSKNKRQASSPSSWLEAVFVIRRFSKIIKGWVGGWVIIWRGLVTGK